jgi:hypothetical protein
VHSGEKGKYAAIKVKTAVVDTEFLTPPGVYVPPAK